MLHKYVGSMKRNEYLAVYEFRMMRTSFDLECTWLLPVYASIWWLVLNLILPSENACMLIQNIMRLFWLWNDIFLNVLGHFDVEIWLLVQQLESIDSVLFFFYF